MHPINRKSVFATLALASAWPLAAQTAPEASAPATSPAGADEEVILLTPFEVTSSADKGYTATETLAGTRVRKEAAWTAVGCALYRCPGLTYGYTVVCDYAPGGNLKDQSPY